MQKKNYESNAIVEFTPDTSINKTSRSSESRYRKKPVEPFDPTTPDTGNKPNEGTTGPLSIDYASSLDFGKKIKFQIKMKKILCKSTILFFLADGSGPDFD